ncbi:MAG: TPM domain-containing protein [Clostridia bacterium]
MKKIISMILVLVMTTAFFTCVSAATDDSGYVLDYSDMLSQSEIENISASAREYHSSLGVDFVVATVNDVGSQNLITYVDDFVEYYEIGGESKDRVVLVVDTVGRSWEARADGIAGDVIDPDELYDMGTKAATYLSSNDYYTAFVTFMNLTESEIRNPDAFSFDFIFSVQFLVAMIIVVVITLIIMISLKNQLNTAKPQKSAGYYIKNFNIFRSRDIYLYSHTTRTEIPKNNGGSGGGGGSRGGSSGGGSRAGGRF